MYTDSDAAVAAVQDGTVKAFLTDYPTLQYYADQLPCDVTVRCTMLFRENQCCYCLRAGWWLD